MKKSFYLVGCMVAVLSVPFAALAPAAAAETSAGVAISTACAVANQEAAVSFAAIPEAPQIAGQMHATGTTLVQIDIDANGTIYGTQVAKSSGNSFLDRAALSSTRLSSFRPEIRDCVPVGGTYLFQVDFES